MANMAKTAKTLTTSQLRASKIIHRAPRLHPLVRFVSEEAIATLFNIPIAEIERIECYYHVIYVHARHVSRFVSYADLPPMLMVQAPSLYDGWRWRRRWRRRGSRPTAPEWWQDFYTQQMRQCPTINEVRMWWEVVQQVENFLTVEARMTIINVYEECEGNFQEMVNLGR